MRLNGTAPVPATTDTPSAKPAQGEQKKRVRRADSHWSDKVKGLMKDEGKKRRGVKYHCLMIRLLCSLDIPVYHNKKGEPRVHYLEVHESVAFKLPAILIA